MRGVDLVRQYECSTASICTVVKQELLRAVTPAKSITIISKLWSYIHEKMESLLLVWLTE